MGHTHPRFPRSPEGLDSETPAWIPVMPPRSLCCNPNPNRFSDPTLCVEQTGCQDSTGHIGPVPTLPGAGGSSAFSPACVFMFLHGCFCRQGIEESQELYVCVCALRQPTPARSSEKYRPVLRPAFPKTAIRNKIIPWVISVFLLL